MPSPMSTLSPERPRMIPLQRINTMAVMPTIIVTSPGFQVSRCPRARIQDSTNGAVAARVSRMSRVPKTCQALTPSPPLAPPSREFGLPELVVNQGRKSDRNRTAPAAIPTNSPGDSREVSKYPPPSAREASIRRNGTCLGSLRTTPTEGTLHGGYQDHRSGWQLTRELRRRGQGGAGRCAPNASEHQGRRCSLDRPARRKPRRVARAGTDLLLGRAS